MDRLAELMAALEDVKGDGGEEEITIEEEQDEEPLRIARDPKLPSPEDVECHRCCHIPFRSWCRWCVMGRGRGDPHLSSAGSTIPIVGLDYFFIDDEAVKKREELSYPQDADGEAALEAARATGALIKCLIVRCASTKCLFGHVIPRKGADEENFTVNLVVKNIEWLGHTEVIVKGDNEPSLQALIARTLEVIRVTAGVRSVTTETPPAYDSQSNGAVEVGVSLIRGLFRTIRLCLEARISKKIPTNHALMPWMLLHTCFLLNIKSRGSDGLTPWARARGRAFGQKIIGFGEKVLFKLPTKGPHAPANMSARWADAVLLGYSPSSNTYILSDSEDRIVTARSLSRLPMQNRWSADALAAIKATPWSERARHDPEVRFQDGNVPSETTAETAAPTPTRRFRINDADLRQYGFTDGCPQCTHVQRYGKAKAGLQHHNSCRQRILSEIAKTDAGKARLEAHQAREDRYLAEHIEHNDATTGTAPAHDATTGIMPASALSNIPDVTGGVDPPRSDVTRNVRFEDLPEPREDGPHPRDPSINARLLQPYDEVHQHIEAGRSAAEERSRHDPNEDVEGMDVDADETMGFIGSLEPNAGDYASELLLYSNLAARDVATDVKLAKPVRALCQRCTRRLE